MVHIPKVHALTSYQQTGRTSQPNHHHTQEAMKSIAQVVSMKFKVVIDFSSVTNQYYVSVYSRKRDMLVGTSTFDSENEAIAYGRNILAIQ
jgi:dihydrodipicolinate reductase